jgi:hypothetical protein
MTDKPYIAQLQDTSCFVVAIANCLIYLGLPVPDLEKAKDIAACRNGSTIHTKAVVEFMGAPLKPTRNRYAYRQVFKHGGILTIMHPICNGHSMFVFPDKKDKRLVTAVNSWLGPNVYTLAPETLIRFIQPKCNIGMHWVLDIER